MRQGQRSIGDLFIIIKTFDTILRDTLITQVGQYGKKRVSSGECHQFHGNSIPDQKIFGFFRPGVLLPFSIDFRGFPTENGDFFLSFPARYEGRSHPPE